MITRQATMMDLSKLVSVSPNMENFIINWFRLLKDPSYKAIVTVSNGKIIIASFNELHQNTIINHLFYNTSNKSDNVEFMINKIFFYYNKDKKNPTKMILESDPALLESWNKLNFKPIKHTLLLERN